MHAAMGKMRQGYGNKPYKKGRSFLSNALTLCTIHII